MLPAWLYWDGGRNQYGADRQRAAIVRGFFETAFAGWSPHKVAHWLNDQTDMGRGTPGSLLAPILCAENVVIGAFVRHQKCPDANGQRQRKALDPTPTIIPPLWMEKHLKASQACSALQRQQAGMLINEHDHSSAAWCAARGAER
jgi:hypothetical protein